MSATCDHRTARIAGREACSVYRCGCGCIHLHIGATTLRLSAEAFEEIAQVAVEASRSLREAGEAVPGDVTH